MPTAAEVIWVRGFCRRARLLLVVVAVVAGVLAAWAAWEIAAVRPVDGPVLLRLWPGRGVHPVDLVGAVAAFGTAAGVVAAATGTAVRVHPR